MIVSRRILIIAAFVFAAGCSNPAGTPEPPAFVPVTDISGAPSSGTAGSETDLTVAAVVPSDATNTAIVWTVKDPGSTGITGTGIVNGRFTPANAGTVTLTATVPNGSAPGADFVRDFDLVIFLPGDFVPVTNIINVPESGAVGSPVSLAATRVVPDNATYQTISWRLDDAGTTGITGISGNAFTPAAAGTVTLTALIAGGTAEMTPYIRTFTIAIEPAFVPVTGISGMPETLNAVTGSELDLNSGLSVLPPEATNKTIEWSVVNAGTTGLTTALVQTGVFAPAQAGTAILTASVPNGVAQGQSYTGNMTIVIIKPVADISGVPANGTKGQAFSLAGALVSPADATNTAIVWSVKSAGTTGVVNLNGNSFTPPNTGTLILTATIANGSTLGTAYVQDFSVRIVEPGATVSEFGLGADRTIMLRGNKNNVSQGTLSGDAPIIIERDADYYVSIISDGDVYSDIVWYLNGTKQPVTGALIYPDTSVPGTIRLSAEAKRNALFESSETLQITISN